MRFQTANKAEETRVAPKSGFAEKPSRRARLYLESGTSWGDAGLSTVASLLHSAELTEAWLS